MKLVLAGSASPIEGAGALWKAVEGEPAFRRLVEIPDDSSMDCRLYHEADDLWPGKQVSPRGVTPPDRAAALLAVGPEPEDGFERDFNSWMDQEHLPALATVSGVLCAHRYEAISGSPHYIAVYHLTDPRVCSSEEWRRAGDTPWRTRMRRQTRNRVRGLYVRETAESTR